MNEEKGKSRCLDGERILKCDYFIVLMHQSIPPAPSPSPRETAGHLPALSVPGVWHLQILHCLGAGHLLILGPFPSFWHSRRFLSEYNYTEGFVKGLKKSHFKSRMSLIVRVNVTDVSTTYVVVLFRVKVSCITSVDGIILWLLIWLVNYVAMLLVVCQ